MKHKQTGRPSRIVVTAAIVSWAAALPIVAMIGWQLFRPAGAAALNGRALAAVLALMAVIALAWQYSQARARRRLLAALDAYAQREISRSKVLLAERADIPSLERLKQ